MPRMDSSQLEKYLRANVSHKTLREMADELKLCPRTVHRHLKSLGISKSDFRKIRFNVEKLRYLRLVERLSTADIAKKLGASVTTVYRALRDLDLHGEVGKGRKAVLTPDIVLQVKKCLAEGASQTEVASLVGVTKQAINQIATGRVWKDV